MAGYHLMIFLDSRQPASTVDRDILHETCLAVSLTSAKTQYPECYEAI